MVMTEDCSTPLLQMIETSMMMIESSMRMMKPLMIMMMTSMMLMMRPLLVTCDDGSTGEGRAGDPVQGRIGTV